MDQNERLLTIVEAYRSMLRFLELYSSELRDATVADVLSDGAFSRGGTADPGAWGMWLEALNSVTDNAFAQVRNEYRARWKK